jgi:hypothetical protein
MIEERVVSSTINRGGPMTKKEHRTMPESWLDRALQRVGITRRWLLLAGLLVFGWVWVLFVAQYRYQLLEDADTNQRFFLLTLVFTIGVTFAFVATMRREEQKRYQRLIVLAIATIIFGMVWFAVMAGYLLTLNAVLDRSSTATHQTRVVDAYVKNGRSTHFWVVLKSWRSGEEMIAVSLLSSKFRALDFKPGDCAEIGIRSGALGFPWIAYFGRTRIPDCGQ